jgi:DNA mismatch repair protein MutS
MAGVPRHSAEHYVSRLVEKGYYVALCEQVGDEPVDGVMPREMSCVTGPLMSPDSPVAFHS